jgi:excisionase family DNA binding protein
MLTAKQAAERIGVSDSLIYEWCTTGKLVHFRFGRIGKRGKLLIDEKDLEAFLTACRQEARPQNAIPTLRHIKLS